MPARSASSCHHLVLVPGVMALEVCCNAIASGDEHLMSGDRHLMNCLAWKQQGNSAVGSAGKHAINALTEPAGGSIRGAAAESIECAESRAASGQQQPSRA